MKRLLQSTAVIIILAAGATAHARTTTYEFVGQHPSTPGFGEYLQPGPEGFRVEITVSSTDYSSPIKVERLEMYPLGLSCLNPSQYRCLPPLVATGFRNMFPSETWATAHQATIKNWSLFSNITANVWFNHGYPSRVVLAAHDEPGLIDPYGGYQFFEIHPNPLKDISPSKTVDTARIKLDGKRLIMKLQDRPGSSSGAAQNAHEFVIDTLWMGHGHTNLYIPGGCCWTIGNSHRLEITALNVETISGPNGDQIMLSVSFRDWSQGSSPEQFVSESVDLRVLLEQAFGPSP